MKEGLEILKAAPLPEGSRPSEFAYTVAKCDLVIRKVVEHYEDGQNPYGKLGPGVVIKNLENSDLRRALLHAVDPSFHPLYLTGENNWENRSQCVLYFRLLKIEESTPYHIAATKAEDHLEALKEIEIKLEQKRQEAHRAIYALNKEIGFEKRLEDEPGYHVGPDGEWTY